MAFLIDANILIDSKNRHYGFDFCPAFWDWLVRENQNGEVFSVEAVRAELLKQEDELSQWAKELDDGFFLAPSADVVAAMTKLSIWVQNENFRDAAKSEFLDSADYRLISHALATGMTVVTYEKQQDTKKKVKIPNACHVLNVEYVTLYEAIRSTSAKFVLDVA